nr:hypothetical protein FFPRI1PSEUD_27680 [Pseudomonas sp. FFPRI_1]
MESNLLPFDDTRSILYREGCLYFLPLATVFELMHMPNAQKHLYEQAQHPGWLTWKTFSKWFQRPPSAMQMRPSQLGKLLRMLRSRPSMQPVLEDALAKDVLWRPYVEWSGMLAGSLFAHAQCTTYWKARLQDEWDLVCRQLPIAGSLRARVALLAESTLARELGCPGTPERLLALLATTEDDDALLKHTTLHHCRIADCVSVLLRFAAWLVVDGSLINWQLLAQDGFQDPLLMEQFLPRVGPQPQQWSNPLGDCLEHFARLCRSPSNVSSCAALGQLWAQHQYHKGQILDLASKQRSLRDWISGTKGRPQPANVRSLAQAVSLAAGAVRGLETTEDDPLVDSLAHMLHFAETCRFLQQEMTRAGLPDSQISQVFACYGQEYRRARQLLGVPLPES